MRILFSTTAGAGHVGPLVPFVRACEHAGHEVVVAGPPLAERHVRRAGLPYRGFAAAAEDDFDRVRAALHAAAPEEEMAIDELGQELGLAPDPGGERMRRTPLLTLAPAALQPSSRDWRSTPRLRFRAAGEPGPSALPDWWGGSEEPLVYLSFGTEAQAPTHGYYPSLYRGAVDALADLPVRVLLTIDSADPAELGPLPKSVHVERWIPQAAVMPHAAAMVGHGGSGSTLAALTAGVPTALVGLFADQPGNAELVQQAGAGLALDGKEAALPRLADAVRELLGDPSYRINAGRISADIRALAPIDEAAAALAEIAEQAAVAA